ncbi:MAG: DNA repair protein RecO [Parcubacteria group bacterium]|nr:MAG: DNA repair protein RecO [Parcubacteria group bacterium]
MSFKTEAFVLRSRTWREADRLYDLFTPQEGVISAVLKSAAKAGNKLSGHLLPFAKVRVMIGRGRMDHLAGVDILKNHENIRTNLRNLFLASLVAELFLEQDHGGRKEDEFKLLEDVLTMIDDDKLSPDTKLLMVRIFLWKFLAVAGWRPELEECLICRTKITNSGKYVPGRGIICVTHQDQAAVHLSAEMLDFLRLILRADWQAFGQIAVEKNLNKEWLRLSQLFYQTVYDRPSQALKLFTYG